MKLEHFGAAALALLLLAGCGRGDTNPNQPSADERRALDNIAAKADAEAETFDTSADSLVPVEGDALDGNAAAGAAGNATAPSPANNRSAGNAAVPR